MEPGVKSGSLSNTYTYVRYVRPLFERALFIVLQRSAARFYLIASLSSLISLKGNKSHCADMLIWVIFAILTAMAALLIVAPLWSEREEGYADLHDLAVYKQQLAEIEDEKARGLLGEAEAEAARIEVSRRILQAAEKAGTSGRPLSASFAPYLVIGLIAVVTMGVYLHYGAPQFSDQPLAARMKADEQPSIEGLVARVEERLKSHPDDATGWNVIGPVYLRMGRYADAAEAFRKANDLLGETPDRLGELGEALTLANSGVVTGEAQAAFRKALAGNPSDDRSEFWLAVASEQKGQLSEAAQQYRRLLGRELAPNVKNLIEQRIANIVARISGEDTSLAERQAMIDSMVTGLAERLKTDGSDLEGWLKLIRAYTVLGRRDDAQSAVEKARNQFAGDQNALGQIDQMAKTLGLKS